MNKFLISIIIIAVTFLLLVSLLLNASFYFYTDEIRSLTSQCNDRDGEVKLEIHNNLSGSYSFECKLNNN